PGRSMSVLTGRRVPLSLPRRWIDDLMAASRRVPIVTFERRMDVSAGAAAPAALSPAPAGAPLFLQAVAVVAPRPPGFRPGAPAGGPEWGRASLPFPVPHLYEADASIGSLAIEREFGGEPAVFFALVRTPDRQSIPELVGHLDRWKREPVEAVREFRRLVKYS